MSLLHHPDEDILSGHAMGRLTRGQGLVIEAHLAHCPVCRAGVDQMEAVGGALLETLPPANLATDALAQALVRLDAPEPPPPPPKAAPAGLEGIDVPAILGDLPIGRRRWLAPGVWMRPLLSERGGESNTYLIRAAARMQLVQHGHNGPEFTCVLKGAYRDPTGGYGAGDFQFADKGLDHGPLADPDGECICLISAEGPMQMRGLIGKLMQPFVGL